VNPGGRGDIGTREPLLEVRGLSVEAQSRSGPATVVDHVDFSIGRGEIFALVGESGSGKTMTALAIMRLLPHGARIASGTVELDGEDLVTAAEARMNQTRGSRIALIFQQPREALDPTASVGSQVTESLRGKSGWSRQRTQERGLQLLKEVGIADPVQRMHAYAHELSGGMAQRVMIAAALSGHPALLLADEPTTSLDVTVQAQILRLLLDLRDQLGLAILLITHDLASVAPIADRIGVMYAGRIVEIAPAADLLKDPQHPYSRALVRAALLTADSDGHLYAIPGRPSGPLPVVHGCSFVSRCSLTAALGIEAKCMASEPSLVTSAEGRACRCWATQPIDSPPQ
jgi:peptide/nickel transport system ATP-binding protein